MSDVKYCPSCGTCLSISSAYCFKCGTKQDYIGPEISTKNGTENLVELSNTNNENKEVQLAREELIVGTEPVTDSINVTDIHNEKQESTEPTEPTVSNDSTELTESTESSESTEPLEDRSDEEVKSADTFGPDSKSPEVSTDSHTPPQENPATQSEPAPENPSLKYYQSLNLQEPEKKRRRFPVFFTVVWVLLFASVAAWSYYFYLLYISGGDLPLFTEDAQRIVLFLSAVFILIYTGSLKLSMKKFRVFPTILLVLAGLVIFYLFCMVELTDGDWLHDFMSNITEQLLTALKIY